MSALIELQDLHFAYPGEAPVLCGASLTVAEGERVCLTGSNGAGKSTLLQLIVGLLHPQRGKRVLFGHERSSDADFHDVRRLAGLVFQDPDDQLFCPTVAEDVAFGPLNLGKSMDEAMQVVDEVLDQLQLARYKDRVTHKLSGGEKRLVTLATVLAMKPRVLLLDEPSNALDENAKARLVEILNALPQSMLFVSHDAHFRRKVCTRVVALQDGVMQAPAAPRCKHAVAPGSLAAV